MAPHDRAGSQRWLAWLAPLAAAGAIATVAPPVNAQPYWPMAPSARASASGSNPASGSNSASVSNPASGSNSASGGNVDRWQAAIGVRASVVRDAGLDPFSTGDALAQFSAAVVHTLRGGIGFVPALGLATDIGSTEAAARGADATLGTWRLAVVLEPRYVPTSGFYVAARIAPGVLRTSATLRDASTPAPLATSYWTSSLDASLGAGARLNAGVGPIGLWLVGDAGYGWTPKHGLTLAPELPARDASKAGSTDLGSLSPRGMFARVSLAVSY
jgi:hypothetical protein